MRKWFDLYLLAANLQAAVFPIQFSISETKIVHEIPEKTRDFAVIIPGNYSTYIFKTEPEYYQGYRESYFAVTCKRGGWDCLRHYEILANGCIPYFIDLDQCDSQTMVFLPKDLILEAMRLEGVSYLKIDHAKFNLAKYYEILNKLIAHTRKYLTAKKMAQYLLDTVEYVGGNVLFLSQDESPDYLSSLTLIGLKELLGEKVVDLPKISHIYKTYPNPRQLYGMGFSYTHIVDDLPMDRERIEERIRNKEFDLIIYGTVHKYDSGCNALLFSDLVCQNYAPEKIVHLCGRDTHPCEWRLFLQSSPLFLREF